MDSQRFAARVAHRERLVEARHKPPKAARLDRVAGQDSTGAAWAEVDSLGRCIDIGLSSCWWGELGPGLVAAALLEALTCARLKAELAILAALGHDGPPLKKIMGASEGDERVVPGRRGLFRLHLRGGLIVRAEATALTENDTDRLVADVKDALSRVSSWGPRP